MNGHDGGRCRAKCGGDVWKEDREERRRPSCSTLLDLQGESTYTPSHTVIHILHTHVSVGVKGVAALAQTQSSGDRLDVGLTV